MRHRSSSRGGSMARRAMGAFAPVDEKSLTEKLLSNVTACDLSLLDPSFSSGLAEALVVIRKSRKSSKLIKGTMQHLTGTDVSNYDDQYFLLRVWAPQDDPGGAILFLIRIQRPDTGEFIIDGVELVIPVRSVVGLGTHSVSDGDPVKHFKVNAENKASVTGRARVLASFVQGQVALDIKIDPSTVDQHLKKKNVTRITGIKRASDLPNGQLILCFESMEERNVWLEFLTNLLMDVETADLRLEELKSRRRNRTIGPTGAVTEASLLSSIEASRLPPPPKPTGISAEDIARYRLYLFRAEGTSSSSTTTTGGGGGASGGSGSAPKTGDLGNIVVGPEHSLSVPPAPDLLCRMRGETELVRRRVTAKQHETILVGGQPVDLSNALIQATIPYSEPFQVIKVPHDAASAAEELKNGGPIQLMECRAKDPAERQKWMEWMIFVKGAPQSEDDTYTYREMEKKIELEKQQQRTAAANATVFLSSGRDKGGEINLDVGDNTVTTQAQLAKKASNLRNLAAHLGTAAAGGGGGGGDKGKANDDKSSRTSIGSHVYSKSKKLPVYDAWKEFTFGHDEEIVMDARGMKDLLYDTSIDWSLPRNMLPMPVEYSGDEQQKMSRKKEEINQQRRVQQLLALQQAQRETQERDEEIRLQKIQHEKSLNQYSNNISDMDNNNNSTQDQMTYSFNSSEGENAGGLPTTPLTSPIWGVQQQRQQQQQHVNGDHDADRTSSFHRLLHLLSPASSSSAAPGIAGTPSSGAGFATRGCWAYVQLSAQGMPPMVDEAAFELRYFFAACNSSGGGGRILVLNGEDLSKVWYNCRVSDVVGFQIGSRSGGPLSFVMRVRDTNAGGAVLRMTVVCSCVMERSMMIQFLQQVGGIEQIPATVVSDFRDGCVRHLLGRKVSRRPIATPSTVFDMIDVFVRNGGINNEEVDEFDLREALVAQNQYEQHQVRYHHHHHHQQQQDSTYDDEHRHHRRRQQAAFAPSVSSSQESSHHSSDPSPDSRSTSSNHTITTTTSSETFPGNDTNNKNLPQHLKGTSLLTAAVTSLHSSPPPHVPRTAPSSPHKATTGNQRQQHHLVTLGRLSTEFASPHPNVIPESYSLVALTSEQPTTCQLCGTPNKAECALCKATGLFHPEFLAARATERQMLSSAARAERRRRRRGENFIQESQSMNNFVDGDAEEEDDDDGDDDHQHQHHLQKNATSILHFMPPMQVVPRQDVAVSFRRFVDASKRSSDVPQFAKYKEDSEKLSRAVLDRYCEECRSLGEEADLHLFAASVEGYGPQQLRSAVHGLIPRKSGRE